MFPLYLRNKIKGNMYISMLSSLEHKIQYSILPDVKINDDITGNFFPNKKVKNNKIKK